MLVIRFDGMFAVVVFKYTATAESYTDCHTLSLRDALPISSTVARRVWRARLRSSITRKKRSPATRERAAQISAASPGSSPSLTWRWLASTSSPASQETAPSWDTLALSGRSEERRVGKECVSPGSSRWVPDHLKKNKKETNNKLKELIE